MEQEENIYDPQAATKTLTGGSENARFSGTLIDYPTCDYTWYHTCGSTTIAMYLDSLARGIEPCIYNNYNPFSIKINDYFFNNRNNKNNTTLGWQEICDKTYNYVKSKCQTSTLKFEKYIYFSGNDNYTNDRLFSIYKDGIIKYDIPIMVGFNSDKYGAHIMLGVGYANASNGDFYIVRDTWTGDGTPYRTYYASSTSYNYRLIGLKYTYTSSGLSLKWRGSTLKKGCNNINVKRLRYRLNSLYYDVNNLNSTSFDSNLEEKVKQFQADNGLTVDGIVGNETYKLLVYAHMMKYDNETTYYRILSNGKKGDDVSQLQARLENLGFYTSSLDGIYGSETVSAVKKFQSKYKLEQDGKAGPKTMKVLVYKDF